MSAMNAELKKVVKRVKSAQEQLQKSLDNRSEWIDDARKYAERQGKEVRKLLTADVSKVRSFIEGERKNLEKLQKQIPGEVAKLRKFVVSQRKELEKLLNKVASGKGGKKKASKGKAKSTRKKTTSTSASA